jgi:hypothetical protein
MAAELIAGGKIIGWFQGRLEFGDRALGNRSILADPRDPEMKNRVNLIIKYREAFRPFAPAILAERVGDFFANAAPTPFMEKVFPIHAEQQKEIPAVTHVDGTGRLQTVTREQNPAFHALISHFDEADRRAGGAQHQLQPQGRGPSSDAPPLNRTTGDLRHIDLVGSRRFSLHSPIARGRPLGIPPRGHFA